jgi:hypothetical protein
MSYENRYRHFFILVVIFIIFTSLCFYILGTTNDQYVAEINKKCNILFSKALTGADTVAIIRHDPECVNRLPDPVK